jgi:hypothetical protein
MQQQNEADEKLKRTSSGVSGGTRWSGASAKKGSVTSYARDVQERHRVKKQSSSEHSSTVSGGVSRDPAKRATAAARRAHRESSDIKGGFNDKSECHTHHSTLHYTTTLHTATMCVCVVEYVWDVCCV